MFFFAWVEAGDTTFGPQHQREDEQIFSVRLSEAENEFPGLDIEIVNPYTGLLAEGRKQWAWLSWQRGPGDVVPLFLGRLIGVPDDMQAETIRLTFQAHPTDYRQQKAVLAETLRELPWFDPAFVSESERNDPDAVLEARAELFHVDRVSHQVTTTGILAGEDGTVTLFGEDDFLYDDVSISLGNRPARRCVIEATARWDQRGSGSIEITRNLLAAFAQAQPEHGTMLDGRQVDLQGNMAILSGEAMIEAWPRRGDPIGGGWTVGTSNIQAVGKDPIRPTLMRESEMLAIRNFDSGRYAEVYNNTFGRGSGLLVQVIDHTDPLWGVAQGRVDYLWVPIWRMYASMALDWRADRARTEVIRFTIDADVQPILSDPADDEAVLRLTLGPYDVDERVDPAVTEDGSGLRPMRDLRLPSYFKTDRGRQSLEYLMALGRARLLARARCVEVAVSVAFERALDLTCRHSLALVDSRLPGGQVAGKVKSMSLIADGDTGQFIGNVVIACTIGRDGDITPQPGEPSYAAPGYMAAGYQRMDGRVRVPLAGDLGYSDFGDAPIDDDGVDLMKITRHNAIESIAVSGGLSVQEANLRDDVHATPAQVIDRINQLETTVTIRMVPLTGGPFNSEIAPQITDLKVPRTIDLEAS